MAIAKLPAMPALKEDDEQASVISYLLFRKNHLGERLRWHHSPNGEGRVQKIGKGGKRYCPAGQRLAAQGTSPGFPDLFVSLLPAVDGGVPIVVYIEMKRAKGRPSDVSTEQAEWLEYLSRCGWHARVCYGAQQAINFLRECGI